MKKIFIVAISLFIVLSISFASNHINNGYIPKNQTINIDSIIGSPPTTDSLAFSSDKAISETVFSQNKNTDSYKTTIHDASTDKDIHIADFSKIFGQEISKDKTPAIYRLLRKSTTDVSNIKQSVKEKYKRVRPFVFFNRKPCDSNEDPTSYSYPSGHSSRAWTYAMILSELKPQVAEQLFALANRKSKSRVNCGAHWESDVKAARTVALINFAVLNGNEKFLEDLKKAKKEIDQ
ncbi:acid phosphatase [Francisella halioticida]|uniref:Acid phosphatase n=1 Tax=Francisella halioticida TaxID=549298 RepID=A0ABN5AYS2_9GAMM|nr:acid phosphatase [Francisella halioticida]